MWVESVKSRKNLIVSCEGYDFKRTIIFVMDCTDSEIPEGLLSEIMDNSICQSQRMGMIRYFERMEKHPDDNEISNVKWFRKFFNIENEE